MLYYPWYNLSTDTTSSPFIENGPSVTSDFQQNIVSVHRFWDPKVTKKTNVLE